MSTILFDGVQDALLDFVYRGIPVVTTNERWLGLVRAGTDEISGGAYVRARIDATLTEAVDGQLTNTTRVLFPIPTADWATDGNNVTHTLLCEQAVGGNSLAALPLAASLTIRAGDTVDITPGRFLGSVANNLTPEWKNIVANLLFRAVAQTTTTERWLGLFKDGGEVSGGGYTRVRIDDKMSAPVGGEIKNSMVIAFPQATGVWSEGDPITHLMLCESSTAGRLVCRIPLEYGVQIAAGDTFRFEPGQLTLGFSEA